MADNPSKNGNHKEFSSRGGIWIPGAEQEGVVNKQKNKHTSISALLLYFCFCLTEVVENNKILENMISRDGPERS